MRDTDDVPEPRTVTGRRWRRRYVALLLIGVVVATGWVERRRILTRVIDDRLATAKVPVRYRIADLGAGRQRLTDVVVGDPANPDLTADWIETRTGIGLSGPYLASVAAGNVRARARLVDGRLSLGSIDRLLPAAGGEGPVLPALRLSVGTAQVQLATPAGPVMLAFAGSGRLDDGFAGPVAAVAPRLTLQGCAIEGVRVTMRVRSLGSNGHGGQDVRLTGPVHATRAACPQATLADIVSGTRVNLDLGARGQSSVEAQLSTGALVHRDARAASVAGTVSLAQGSGKRFGGRIALTASEVRALEIRAGALTMEGGIAVGADGALFDGSARIADADLLALAPHLRAPAGTPVAPLLARLDRATTAAARRVAAESQLHLRADGQGIATTIRSARLRTGSGAFATLQPAGDATTVMDWQSGRGPRIAADLSLGGGDLPRLEASIFRAAGSAPVRVSARMERFTADGASLSLAPVDATIAPDGAARVTTRAVLSGPLGDGRVEALTLPIDLRRSADGAIVLGPGCAPVVFRRLAVAGLDLDPARITLCPTESALVRMDRGGGVAGGARIAALDLHGRLGTTPLAVSAADVVVRLGANGFVAQDVTARLGAPERVTQILAQRLSGTVTATGVAGDFAGAGGQIANVPLLLSDGAGDWRLAGGTLTLAAAAQVADADPSPRFRPMQARGLSLTLADGRIAVTGALHEPTTGTHVADVRIGHRLSTGEGGADLVVPGIAFTAGLQPELLTPLTFGVIADVRGTVDGRGRIDWGPAGVTSRGDFGTAKLDLAAAFGPATGIAGRVRFDDLLGLHTPPQQVATIASVNPGIAVENGTVRYQLLGGTRVQVEGAEWPFAGGTLTLDPTLLDFAADRARNMTFRVAGARADQFLQQFDFENLNATGVFDGVLPMIFDAGGGRIENGRLTMREGGGTIAYVGALGQEQLGVWGNLAFQALRSLRYRNLTLTMNGPLAGEMVTDVRFAGVSQGEGAKSSFIVRRLQRLPFVFNVRIRAPFRGLIDSAASFYDPRRLIQRNLPALLEEQNRRVAPAATVPAIQPPASETMR